jgi:hypothetical protein
MKICTLCGKETDDFESLRRASDGLHSWCRECRHIYHSEYQKNKRGSLKDKIFEKHGNKCSHCGFSDKRAFQIDHVNNDGSKDRPYDSKTGHRIYPSSIGYLRKVLNDTSGSFQILCANCNWIKRIEN